MISYRVSDLVIEGNDFLLLLEAFWFDLLNEKKRERFMIFTTYFCFHYFVFSGHVFGVDLSSTPIISFCCLISFNVLFLKPLYFIYFM